MGSHNRTAGQEKARRCVGQKQLQVQSKKWMGCRDQLGHNSEGCELIVAEGEKIEEALSHVENGKGLQRKALKMTMVDQIRECKQGALVQKGMKLRALSANRLSLKG